MTLLISHIPKTAGSSLKELVGRLTPGTVWAYGGELRLAAPDLEFALRFRAAPKPPALMGHFSHGAHRLLGIEPRYATVLRDPLDRVVSLYRYQKSLPDSAFAPALRAGMSLVDFVGSHVTEMTNNHACRIIAGIPPESGLHIQDTWLLDLALHNLRRDYVLVGVLESIDSFLAGLGQQLNWPAAELPRANVTAGDTLVLDAQQRAVLTEHNALDMALYRHVVAQSAARRAA